MLKLYHNDMSVCAQKVRLTLAELGLEWESHHLTLRGDEQHRPEYLRINRKGQIPALVDGEVIIVESTVINEYLADAYDGTALLPRSATGRAKMRWWTRQLDDDVHNSIGIISQSIAFIHQYLQNPHDKLNHILKSIPEEARREIKKQAFATGIKNPALPMATRRMYKFLGDMDAELTETPWLAGDSHSLADIGILSYVLRVEHLIQLCMFDNRPHLVDWLQRMKSRPSYNEAIGAWLNADYLKLMKNTGEEAQPVLAEMVEA